MTKGWYGCFTDTPNAPPLLINAEVYILHRDRAHNTKHPYIDVYKLLNKHQIIAEKVVVLKRHAYFDEALNALQYNYDFVGTQELVTLEYNTINHNYYFTNTEEIAPYVFEKWIEG